jgi:hypothetical protein
VCLLPNDGGFVHVVEHASAVRGVLVLKPRDGALFLDKVRFTLRRRALGWAARCWGLLSAPRSSPVTAPFRLYTHEAMTENIELYRRIGYAETHRVEEYGFRLAMANPVG